MQKENTSSIELSLMFNKRICKTILNKKKEEIALNFRNRCFSTQIPSSFVPRPKAIKAKINPTPMLLNSLTKPVRNSKKSFLMNHDELYLSFEKEELSEYDSDSSCGEETLPSSLVSDMCMNNLRKELTQMKSCKLNHQYKESEDCLLRTAFPFDFNQEDLIPSCRRLSVEYPKRKNNAKGFSILNILELSQ